MRMPNVLIVPATGSIGASRKWYNFRAAEYLRNKSRGLDPDRLVRVRFVSHIDSSRSRDKVGACEARRRNKYQSKNFMRTNGPDSHRC